MQQLSTKIKQNSPMRKENDLLGVKEIPQNALYGIHALRAYENFPSEKRFHNQWYKAMGTVKLACYKTYQKYSQAVKAKYTEHLPVKLIDTETIESLIKAAEDVSNGKLFDWFIVPALQGGAGTSINMNINEIITNKALLIKGEDTGNYQKIDPIEHANIFQSTNDTVPTALKIAVMHKLNTLEGLVNELRESLENLEKTHSETLRIGYTQLQEAVPTSYGKMFSAYSDALSRDWWRISKCSERIKVVNLGGSAIGTGITVPTFFIMEVVPALQQLTNLPITRSENMMDTTSNLDTFVEIHATLEAHTVNFEKMASDIRLLSSDISRHSNEFFIPQKQAGSSIMPGKVNPVIIEFIISSMHTIYANDMLISSLCGQGQLELNAYIPTIGDALLNSIDMLEAANKTLKTNLIDGLSITASEAKEKLYRSASIATALVPYIGYHASGELSKLMKQNRLTIQEANGQLKLLTDQKLTRILSPSNLLKTGFTPSEIKDND